MNLVRWSLSACLTRLGRDVANVITLATGSTTGLCDLRQWRTATVADPITRERCCATYACGGATTVLRGPPNLQIITKYYRRKRKRHTYSTVNKTFFVFKEGVCKAYAVILRWTNGSDNIKSLLYQILTLIRFWPGVKREICKLTLKRYALPKFQPTRLKRVDAISIGETVKLFSRNFILGLWILCRSCQCIGPLIYVVESNYFQDKASANASQYRCNGTVALFTEHCFLFILKQILYLFPLGFLFLP